MTPIDTAAYRSRWRRYHPAVKGVLCGGLLACALMLPPWPAAALVAAATLGSAVAAGVPLGLMARAAAGPLVLIATSAAALLVSVGGAEPVGWAPGGPARAAEVAARASAALGTQLLFVLTTPVADLLARLSRTRLPAALVEVVALTYQMLMVLLGTAHRVASGQAARHGYRSRRAGLRSAGALGGVLFLRSLDRARRLQEGLACRGYTGRLTVLVDERPVPPVEWAAAAAPPLLVAALTLTSTALR
ncbi:cobalt/nickel transport system permease protein [Nocardiopsis flavescens]|uniref:Cobalt/nickel transport system permease protein n=1 Tax=Nocardiopsis flavescens TaxID=758803 RepID=A0A1M6C8T7_9ACTN|nr:cobalt ECF transporter T component CbiQ [Nocardiopsis flavescens]SHI57386.1 cobalt/nickel transport system permease protein [Nocardiopsis flavescens]